MTLPNLTSPTAELIAYRDELKSRQAMFRLYCDWPQVKHCHDLLTEVLDLINRRESCPHEDFTENLEGRKCRTCGLETK